MMEQVFFSAVVAFNFLAASTDAFVAPKANVAYRWAPLRATPADAIAQLDASQQNSVNSIAAAIPDLAPKPDLAWTSQDGVTIGGAPATLDARDAPGPANIAWLAALRIDGKESSLTIFNGPLTDVPHLLSRACVVDDNTLSFALDFRPRADGAYSMKDPVTGEYPGPDQLGRQAFEYSGNRMEFERKFGNEEVVAFMESTKASLESTSEVATSEMDKIIQGPLAMSVTMPLTDGNVAAIAAAREKAAAYWLQWAMDGGNQHRPGAPVNTQYVYDTKYKINAYEALLNAYTQIYGPEDGAKLAAAESGPLDEGYVGGGS
jgi:hypothetical protein